MVSSRAQASCGMCGRDAQNFAGVHDDFFAVDGEFQRAFQDVGDLLVVVMMQRARARLFS